MFERKTYMCLFILVIFLFSMNSFSFGEENINPEEEGMENKLENRYLSFYLNEETTEFAVKKKETGEVWYSNPPLRESQEEMVSGQAKQRLGDKIEITYDEEGGSQDLRMYDLIDSVEEKLFEITKKSSKSIKIEYTFGSRWSEEDYLPELITEESFNDLILDNLNEEDQKTILDNFNKVKIVERKPWENKLEFRGMEINEGVLELFDNYRIISLEDEELRGEIQEAEEQYAEKEEENISEELKERLVEEQEDLFYEILKKIRDNSWDIEEVSEITASNVESFLEIEKPYYLLDDDIMPFEKDDLIDTVIKSGINPQDITPEYTLFGIDAPQPNLEVFSVPIEYQLEGQDFVVKVQGNEIEYPKNVKDIAENTYTYYLHKLDILPYFGANYKDNEEGYIFVPDGSGALIRFNRNSSENNYLSSYVYGEDYTLEERGYKNRYDEQLYLPVYGMNKGEKGFLTIIEEGASLARIRAFRAGARNSYFSVFSSFNLRPKGEIDLGGIGNITMYQDQMYRGDIKLRYKFLSENRADYADMANEYQDYLVDKFGLEKLKSQEELPFFLELTGGILKTKRRFGFPTNVVEPLTEFSEVNYITDELQKNNINNIKLIFRGWQEGGIYNNYPDGVNLANSLGSEEELKELIKDMEEKGVEFYPEVGFLNLHQNRGLLNKFWSRNEAYYFGNQLAEKGKYNVATFEKEKDFRLLRPSILDELIEQYMNDYRGYDLNALALKYMGKQVHSDMGTSEEEVITRDQTVEKIKNNLNKLRESKMNIMVRGANDFTLPFIKNIVDVPESSSNSTVLDESVPFYQIVINGYFNFSGAPFNLANSDSKTQFLKMIETGGLPFYSWIYRKQSLIKDTEFDNYYSVNYKIWLEEAVKYHNKTEKVYKDLHDKKITDHQQIKNDVYQTTYENGVSIIVNYNQDKIEIKGETVEGENFKRIE